VRIDSYRFGEMTVDGKCYHHDLIVTEQAVFDSWWRKEGHALCLEDIKWLLDEPPDLLVVGQGDPGLMIVPDEVRAALRDRGMEVVVAPTLVAVGLFNTAAGTRKVAGAFHLTC
jgi:hypothetical protein